MNAKSNVPWSVKGIDQDARSVAKELARRRGMTLGEFITEMIREKGFDETNPAPEKEQGKLVSGVTTDQLRGVVDTLNRLNDRLKAAESDLALNQLQSKETAEGLNKGLETVFERVKRLESEARGEPSPQIAQRLDKLEGAAEKNSWVKSLVALEKALSTLVEQVENSRDDHDQRLSRNEDLITELQDRLQEEDDAMREELSGLLAAIDSTTERLSDTDRKVQEALNAAREAAESQDETFIERTSQRLQLLGSEIKRTSDQIRGLEGNVSRLSEKIEAGEERSAEGISRVAQSLDTLRKEVEDKSLTRGLDAPTERVRSAMLDAEERVSRLQGDFAAVVDRLEGRDPGPDIRPAALLDAVPYPEEALTDDFKLNSFDDSQFNDSQDEFDRVFDDPLNLGGAPTPSAVLETTAPLAPTDATAERFEPFQPNPIVDDAPGFSQPLFEAQKFETQKPFPDPLQQPARPDGQPGAFDRRAPAQDDHDDQDDWQPAPSLDNPFTDSPPSTLSAERDNPFADDPETTVERAANFVRRAVSNPVENNPALGWALVAVVIAAISFTAVRLSQPTSVEPMVMEPMTAPVQTSAPVQARPTRPVVDANALYLEAKTLLATAVMPEELTEAVGAMTVAAEAGSPLAQYDLGDVYLNGDGVERNGLLARSWFSEASAQGHVQATHRLGYLDINGIGGARDPSGAINHFLRAANAGFLDSIVNLGTLYDPTNDYLPQGMRDAVEAYFWYRLAAARGDQDAARRSENVVSLLSDRDIALAETRLANWRQQNL